MKYCPEIRDEIAGYVRQGAWKRDACIKAGINNDTFFAWMDDHSDFSDAIEKAEVDYKRTLELIVDKAALTQWQAAAWRLERQFRHQYALMSKFEVGQGENKMIVEFKI